MIKKSFTKEIQKFYNSLSKDELKDFINQNPIPNNNFKSNEKMKEKLKEYQKQKTNFCEVCNCDPCDCHK